MEETAMSTKQIPLTLIVAATISNGIGKNGALPWPMLKKEMAYFARVTKRVPQSTQTGSLQSDAPKQTILQGSQRNAVIMGRKTWESIPSKFRPLKDRTNIVISSRAPRELPGVGEEVIVAEGIGAGLEELGRRVRDGRALPLGRAFVIGGRGVYEAAVKLEQTRWILLTRIGREFECDAFFPVEVGGKGSGWVRQGQEEMSRFVGEEVGYGEVVDGSEGEEVGFEFQLYERR